MANNRFQTIPATTMIADLALIQSNWDKVDQDLDAIEVSIAQKQTNIEAESLARANADEAHADSAVAHNATAIVFTPGESGISAITADGAIKELSTVLDALQSGDSSSAADAARVSTPKGETFTTLKARLDTAEEDTIALQADIAERRAIGTRTDIFPEILDMHYDALKGVGWNALESGGELIKTITAAAVKGGFSLKLNSVTSLVAGQLIAYYSGGEYYSNVISSIVGNDVSFNYPLEVDIAINDTLHNFYNNSTHPNTYGFQAIADAAIRDLKKPRGQKLLYRILPDDYSYVGSGTNTDGGFKQDYTEPFSTFDANIITETLQARKVITVDNDSYIKIKVHLKTVDGAVINLQISDTANTVAYYNKNYSNAVKGTSTVIEAVVFLRQGTYNIKIKNLTAGKSFALGKTEVFELGQKYGLNNFDNGVHLLLGDSWFEIAGVFARLDEMFPNATFINFGVGGNKSDALLRRFTGTATDADIKNDPTNYGSRKDATTIPVIDYVWVMCGTNDYSGSVTNTTFKANMDSLLGAILDRGAKPLIYNSSVGQVGVGTSFTLSRQYADLYYGLQYPLGRASGSITPIIRGTTTAGSHTYNIQEGSYYTIGNIVHFTLRVRMSVKDVSMAGDVQITGLPYSPSKITAVSLGQVAKVTYGTGKQLYAQIETDGKITLAKTIENDFAVNIASADVTDNTMFTISGSYIKA